MAQRREKTGELTGRQSRLIGALGSQGRHMRWRPARNTALSCSLQLPFFVPSRTMSFLDIPAFLCERSAIGQ